MGQDRSLILLTPFPFCWKYSSSLRAPKARGNPEAADIGACGSGSPRRCAPRDDEGRHAPISLPLMGRGPGKAGSGGVEPQVRYWRRDCSLLVWPFGPTPTLDPSPQGGGRREHAACSDVRSDPERGGKFANYHMPPIALSPQSSYSGLTRVPMRYCSASGGRGWRCSALFWCG